jgi:glyoxylase-like metal-dependent hydrolase (beta-lactamase superfamily II)
VAIPYVTDIDPAYGQVVQLSPLVRRVVCKNPGRFTFTGTGTYIIGRGEVAVVDPGPDDDDHVAALLAAVSGEEVSHIVITHTHNDHSPAAAVLQTATGARTYGFGPHPVPDEDALAAAKPTTWDDLHPTAEELEEIKKSLPKKKDAKEGHAEQEEPGDMAFTPDIEVGHGDIVRGGTFTLEALHTPGHISNHLCFGLGEEASLFTGDHVMGWSTSVIPPPDGSMADYMASLDLLLDREDRTYYPTHGPPVPDPVDFARALISHRNDRARQILECLASGPKTVPEMVNTMYTATPHILYMAAGQSVLSHLFHLAEAGRVTTDGPLTADALFHAQAHA